MKNYLGISIVALAISLPLGLAAQEEEQAGGYFYATYFNCDVSRQEQADTLVKANTVPVWDAAVADGTIRGWGWLAHQTGGTWRRIQWHMADSIAGLLTAQKTIGERMDAALGDADDEFGKICNSHDDYIWKIEAGNGAVDARGKASISVYMVCDIAREERADEIVKKVFAPVYDKALADGKIKSWGWNSHIIGGKYRRLATMTGANFPDLIKARGEILGAIYGEDENAEAREFSDICTSHSDYLWEIQHEKS